MSGEEKDAWNAAIAALSRRDLTSSEIRRKLAKKRFPRESVDDVLNRLFELGYVNDLKVAYNHALFRVREAKRGPLRIRAEMLRRGLPSDVVEKALSEALPAGEESRLLRDAVGRVSRQSRFSDGRSGRERLAKKLIRDGFPHSAVLAWLHEGGPDGESGETPDEDRDDEFA